MDLDSSLAFYREILGFEERTDADIDGAFRVTVSPAGQAGMYLVLAPSPADPGISLATGDLDAVFEQLEASGAEVVQEAITRPDGVRGCAFFDPAGNVVRVDEMR